MIHHAKHSHTVALIRTLRAIGPLPRKHRPQKLPRQLQPDAIRLAYYNAIHPVVVRAKQALDSVASEILGMLRALRQEQGKTDADHGSRAQSLIDRAAREAADSFRPHQVHDVVMRFAQRTSDFQKEQLNKQVRAAVGVSFASIEKPIRAKLEGFAALNVDLIRTVPERYFDRIRLDVRDAFVSGMHPDTLAQDFEDRYGMAENDARRIARDQIGKLNAQCNEDRQRSLGVTRFVWRGMLDNRERDSHRELEGQTFEWDDPPIDEDTGEDILPGEPVLCRCFSEPDLSELISGASDDDED